MPRGICLFLHPAGLLSRGKHHPSASTGHLQKRSLLRACQQPPRTHEQDPRTALTAPPSVLELPRKSVSCKGPKCFCGSWLKASLSWTRLSRHRKATLCCSGESSTTAASVPSSSQTCTTTCPNLPWQGPCTPVGVGICIESPHRFAFQKHLLALGIPPLKQAGPNNAEVTHTGG